MTRNPEDGKIFTDKVKEQQTKEESNHASSANRSWRKSPMKISDITGTACDGCKHFDVCKFSEEFTNAQQAVSRASIPVVTEEDGKMRHGSRPISCINYIEPIRLRCKYTEYNL